MRCVRAKERNGDHKRGVLNENADVAMIRMIVPGTMRDHNVGFPIANQARDDTPVLECWHELAIMNVEHFGFDTQSLGNQRRFGGSSLCQLTTGHFANGQYRRLSRTPT